MRRIIAGICLAVSLALVIISFFVLPFNVVIMFDETGDVLKTIPRFLVIFIPFVIELTGNFLELKDETFRKGIVIFLIGAVVSLFMIIFSII